MLAFTDNHDGYYEFENTAPPEWYAHLTPTAIRALVQTQEQTIADLTAAVQAHRANRRRAAGRTADYGLAGMKWWHPAQHAKARPLKDAIKNAKTPDDVGKDEL